MSNHSQYINSGQSTGHYASNQPTSPHPQMSYSSTSAPQGYQTGVPQQAYPYYPPQGFNTQNTALHPNSSLSASTLHPLPFQGYPAHTSQASVSRVPSNVYPPGSNYPPQPVYSAYGGAASPMQSATPDPQRVYAYSQRAGPSSAVPSPPLPASTPSPTTSDRFPCPHCDKSFTRNFDRKRHMEIHIPGSSGSNKCRHCYKDYSRSDSLKRHLDNGCEKNPHS
ncbi:hypothetical protein M0805_008874 [Coniferiporia weirii]|nr:hypothetical protein M0805_008874 [Coniferiporia weirii]